MKAKTNNQKSILIVGATSGIGLHLTKLFVKRGYYIWAGYRHEADAIKLEQINPEKIKTIKIDVTNKESITYAFDIINNSKKSLDVLINNSGVGLGGPLELIDLEEIKKLFEINFFGIIETIQIALPLLRESSGRIINISSVSGLLTMPFSIPYSSSKYALESMSDGLRRELASQNIKVSIIEPGFINTAFQNKTDSWSHEILNINPKLLNLYQPALDNFFSLKDRANSKSNLLKKLENATIHSIENSKPKARYLVYSHPIFIRLAINILPSKLVDWFSRKMFKFKKMY